MVISVIKHAYVTYGTTRTDTMVSSFIHLLDVITLVQELPKIYFCRKLQKVWDMIPEVNITQESENPLLTNTEVDLRPEIWCWNREP